MRRWDACGTADAMRHPTLPCQEANMKSRTIAAAVFAVASTAALAQSGPDFSPMKPDNFDETQAQSRSLSSQPDTAYSTPGDNRMLDAYESSTLQPPAESNDSSIYAAPYSTYREPPREGVVILEGTPRQDTIGNGLFNRRGPNDFGA
jgi:hypothetical protein